MERLKQAQDAGLTGSKVSYRRIAIIAPLTSSTALEKIQRRVVKLLQQRNRTMDSILTSCRSFPRTFAAQLSA